MDISSLFSISFSINRCANLSSSLTGPSFLDESYHMPDVASLFYSCDDRCSIGWNDFGIAFELCSDKDPSQFSFLRLCFNVRKSAVYESSKKFCHVFEFKLACDCKPWFLLGDKVKGDRDIENLESSFGAVFSSADKKIYSIRCWISARVLSGYDPYEFRCLGISYSYMWGDEIINMSGGVGESDLSPVFWSCANINHNIK